MPRWIDYQIDALKRLLAEGLSAQQISDRLGEGITRNAVIGQCHRLNLQMQPQRPGRKKHPWSSEEIERLRRYKSEGLTIKRMAELLDIKPRMVAHKLHILGLTDGWRSPRVRSAKLAPRPAPLPPRPMPDLPPVDVEDFTDFDFSGAGEAILKLSGGLCRWPIGDPTRSNFTFCYEPCGEKTYCSDHHRYSVNRERGYKLKEWHF